MKLQTTQKLEESGVRATRQAIFSISQEESDKLRESLKTVDEYKKEAFKALKMDRGSDWCQTDFAVKNDCVIITVQIGSCG